jgi:hypothetical protein
MGKKKKETLSRTKKKSDASIKEIDNFLKNKQRNPPKKNVCTHTIKKN